MNNRFYYEFNKYYKDFRKKESLKWFNANYFVALYTKDDDYITCFETIEETSNYFNIEVKEILRKIRQNDFILFKNTLCKLYLIRKEKELGITR